MIDRKKLSDHEFYEEIRNKRLLKRLDRLLQNIFDYGYSDKAPKWYWSAIKDTLEKADQIMEYNPLNTIIIEETELPIDKEHCIQEPIMKSCWKLLDIFYDKIKDNNLENIEQGLLSELDNAFYKYNEEYLLEIT